MAKLRLSIELYDVVNANGAQATDEALDRRVARTLEGIEQQVVSLLQRRQFTVSWARMPDEESPIFDQVLQETQAAGVSPTPVADPAPGQPHPELGPTES